MSDTPTSSVISTRCAWFAMCMSKLTSPDRQSAVLFRLSFEQRDQLRADARAMGITVQALLERRVLGIEDTRSRSGARSHRDQAERLPLTG